MYLGVIDTTVYVLHGDYISDLKICALVKHKVAGDWSRGGCRCLDWLQADKHKRSYNDSVRFHNRETLVIKKFWRRSKKCRLTHRFLEQVPTTLAFRHNPVRTGYFRVAIPRDPRAPPGLQRPASVFLVRLGGRARLGVPLVLQAGVAQITSFG